MADRRARYDAVADFYVAEAGDSLADAPSVALLRLAGDVRGLRVLDLACGQGRVTRELARRGARASGIDISSALIARARGAEEGDRHGVTYVCGDAALPGALEGEVFDGVVSHFALSDIDELDGVLGTVARLLAPGGFFAFSLLHPCFPGWGAEVASSWPSGEGYFREGWWRTDASGSTIRQKVGSNHRMLSTYLNALVRHGLPIEAAIEPPPPAKWLEGGGREPVPVFLVLRCRRT